MAKTKPSNLTWTPVEDGEYGEVTTTYRSHTLHVASDRDGEGWFWWIDDQGSHDSEGRDEAMQDVIAMVDEIPEPV